MNAQMTLTIKIEVRFLLITLKCGVAPCIGTSRNGVAGR